MSGHSHITVHLAGLRQTETEMCFLKPWDWITEAGPLVDLADAWSLSDTMDLLADVYRAKVGL